MRWRDKMSEHRLRSLLRPSFRYPALFFHLLYLGVLVFIATNLDWLTVYDMLAFFFAPIVGTFLFAFPIKIFVTPFLSMAFKNWQLNYWRACVRSSLIWGLVIAWAAFWISATPYMDKYDGARMLEENLRLAGDNLPVLLLVIVLPIVWPCIAVTRLWEKTLAIKINEGEP